MKQKAEKYVFMARKFVKDILRDKDIYKLTDDLHGRELNEYYFLIDEQELLRGHSQNYHFDPEGIPVIPTYIDVPDSRLIYYPISIGQYGLAIYHTFLKTGAEADRHRFLKIADWFFDNRKSDARLGDYWLTDVPRPEFRINKPWPSAFSQSRAISILLRGYQMTGQERYLETAGNALKIFRIPAAEGGVTTFTNNGPFYEEYPAAFPTMVLDGMFFSLCGLYDYQRVMQDDVSRELFDAGISCAEKFLPEYDLGFWIRYNYCREDFYPAVDPATIGYLRLVTNQLELFHRITGSTVLKAYAVRWRQYDRLPNILRMYYLKYKALKKLNRL